MCVQLEDIKRQSEDNAMETWGVGTCYLYKRSEPSIRKEN